LLQGSDVKELIGELEPFPFRLNRNGALASCFDAFSLREPESTSLENALIGKTRVLSRRLSHPSFAAACLSLKRGRREGRAPADAHGPRAEKKHAAEPQVSRNTRPSLRGWF
jgi:hypothetical protein